MPAIAAAQDANEIVVMAEAASPLLRCDARTCRHHGNAFHHHADIRRGDHRNRGSLPLRRAALCGTVGAPTTSAMPASSSPRAGSRWLLGATTSATDCAVANVVRYRCMTLSGLSFRAVQPRPSMALELGGLLNIVSRKMKQRRTCASGPEAGLPAGDTRFHRSDQRWAKLSSARPYEGRRQLPRTRRGRVSGVSGALDFRLTPATLVTFRASWFRDERTGDRGDCHDLSRRWAVHPRQWPLRLR